MKKIIYYVGCCAWMLAIASCSNDVKNAIDTPVSVVPVSTQTPDGTLKYMEFTASTGANTRTQLTADNDVVWVANDSISIFDGTANRKFTTKDSGASAVFGGEAKSVEAYYALYPYQAGATIENNVIKNVSIPVVQEAKAGSFDGGVNLSVASASTDLQLAFKNVGSLVKFSMSSDKAADVRSVKLTSNDGTAILAGSVNITVGATPTVTSISSQSQVTLKSDTGFEKDKDYYFMVLPGTLSEGFSLTFTDKDNLTWQKTYITEATMNRSNILRLNDIELGTFTTGLLTNLNLIAAAEASAGQTFEKNADGTVSLLNPVNQQLVNTVTNLDLSGKNDPSICDEIGVFSNLEVLDCRYNNIISLDLSSILKLKELNCSGNAVSGQYMTLKTIDISKNVLLTTLSCNNNLLDNLDISNNTNLTYLSCFNNKLVSLDVTKNSLLEYLNCNTNQLTTLDVSKNTALTSLHCITNQLTSLNVTKNILLKELYCSDNQLTSLDLTKNTALETLTCSGNELSNMDLSNNIALKSVTCTSSHLTNIDVTKCLSLTYLYLLDNQLTSLDVTNNTALTNLYFHHNNLTSIDLSKNTMLSRLVCMNNNLTSLDVSKNTALNYLYCQSNKLTNLDVSKNTELLELYCHWNQMETLDVSYNTSLPLASVLAGGQKNASEEPIELNLYVNATQIIQTLNEDYNQNVNVLLKSSGTHEGYNENNYGN